MLYQNIGLHKVNSTFNVMFKILNPRGREIKLKQEKFTNYYIVFLFIYINTNAVSVFKLNVN